MPTPEEFFFAHVHLVEEVARQFHARLSPYGYEVSDLQQELYLVLWKRARKPLESIRSPSTAYVGTILRNAMYHVRRELLIPLENHS